MADTDLSKFLGAGLAVQSATGKYVSTHRATVDWQAFGDSIFALGAYISSGDAIGNMAAYDGRGIISAAVHRSGGRLRYATDKGYQGKTGSILKAVIRAKGSGFAVNDTLAASAGVGVLTVTGVDSSGGIVSLAVTNAGSGYNSPPTFTPGSGSSGTGAIVDAVMGGTGSLGVFGNTLAQGLARFGDLEALAGQIDGASWKLGTNDIPANTPLATMIDLAQQMFTRAYAAGIPLAIHNISPRSAPAPTTAQLRTIVRFNRFLAAWCRLDPRANPNRLRGSFLVDAFAVQADHASATMAPIAGSTIDGLHPSCLGADLEGTELYRAMLPLLYGSSPSAPISVLNAYDATTNPGGARNTVSGTVNGATAAKPVGVFDTTAGTIQTGSGTTINPTGSVPSNCRIQHTSNSGSTDAGSVTCASNVPRTDGIKGTKFRTVASYTAGGSQQTLLFSQGTVPLSSLGLAAGTDVAVAKITAGLSGLAGFTGVKMEVYFKDGSDGNTVLTLADGRTNDAGYSQGDQVVPLRSPQALIPASVTHVAIFMQATCNATTASSGAPMGHTIDWSDFALESVGTTF